MFTSGSKTSFECQSKQRWNLMHKVQLLGNTKCFLSWISNLFFFLSFFFFFFKSASFPRFGASLSRLGSVEQYLTQYCSVRVESTLHFYSSLTAPVLGVSALLKRFIDKDFVTVLIKAQRSGVSSLQRGNGKVPWMQQTPCFISLYVPNTLSCTGSSPVCSDPWVTCLSDWEWQEIALPAFSSMEALWASSPSCHILWTLLEFHIFESPLPFSHSFFNSKQIRKSVGEDRHWQTERWEDSLISLGSKPKKWTRSLEIMTAMTLV